MNDQMNFQKYPFPLLPVSVLFSARLLVLHWFPLLVLLLLVASCEPAPPEVEPEDRIFQDGILVLNEGNYNWGNASLDHIPTGEAPAHSVYQEMQGLPLGDVAQSLLVLDSSLFVVVNNSGKVLRLHTTNLELEGELAGLVSPRYLLPVAGKKAYISDLYADALSVVDLEQMTVLGSIPTGTWTEEMLLADGKVFVCMMGSNKVAVVDPSTDRITDSVGVGLEPNSLVRDAEGKVWVLCSGGMEEAHGQLVRLDPVSLQVEETFEFENVADSPRELDIFRDGRTLYFLKQDLYAMDIAAAELPSRPLFPSEGRNLYRLHSGQDGFVYVTDAIDFVQAGRLLQIDAQGGLVQSWPAGAIPGDVWVFE